MTHFDQVANEWDSPQKINLIALTASKMKNYINLSKKLNILDFGCGTGLLSAEFIDHASKLQGIDTSDGMLKVFNEKFSSFCSVNSKNVNLEKNNIEESNFKDKFDLIISSMTFHHLEYPQKIFTKLSTMLNNNGSIIIVDLVKEDGSFHPDNKKMGVKHFGFEKKEVLAWDSSAIFSNVRYFIIHNIKKNNKNYSLFLSVFS